MLDTKDALELKELLEQRYAELREEIRQELIQSEDQHFIDLAGQVRDLQDESVADLLVDLDLALLNMHIEEVRDIDQALGRMTAGTYGHCADCKGAIGLERLRAWQTAKRCQPCQVMHEKQFAGHKRSSL